MATSPANASLIRVPQDFPTIQAGLDVATPGDTVLVAPGVYEDTVSRTTPVTGTFCAAIPVGVTLKSASGPENTTIHLPTTGAERSWAVVAHGSISQPRELNGFTVTADSGSTSGALIRLGYLVIKNCRFQGIVGNGDQGVSEGGALHVDGSVEAYDSEFIDCHAYFGGGAFFGRTAGGVRLQKLERCTFSQCSGFAAFHAEDHMDFSVTIRYSECNFESNPGVGLGLSYMRNIEIANCTFRQNAGAIEMQYCRGVTVRDSRFTENTGSIKWGVGGLAIFDEPHPPEFDVEVLRNVFIGNSGFTAALGWGGSRGVLEQNIFYGCEGKDSIVLVLPASSWSEDVKIRGNIFSENSATYLLDTNTTDRTCNISWNNSAFPFPGLLSLDPLFCDPANGDFRVAEGSPCQDPNLEGSCGQIGPFGVGCPSQGSSAVTLVTNPPTLIVSGDGQQMPSPGIYVWPVGEQHGVAAEPIQPGGEGIRYVFESWSDGGPNPHTVLVPESATALRAEFGTEYFLNMVPESGGTTIPSSGWYAPGDSVSIVAIPYETSEFIRWIGLGGGAYSGTADSAMVTMLSPITEYALFTGSEFLVSIHGNDGGTVIPESGVFPGGSVITIEAHPDSAHSFVAWIGTGSGSYTGSDSVATITVQGPIEQTAHFARIEAGYSFAVSTSDVDPHQTTSAASNDWRPLYLWATCLDRGLAAFEAEVSTALNHSTFQPLNGVLAAGSQDHLLLAIPNCPVGTDANALLGYWYVYDTGGSLCLIASSETGNLAAVDCDTPNAHLWPDPEVEGFSSLGGGPCFTGTNGCLIPSADPEDPDDPTDASSSPNWVTSFAPPRPNPFASAVDLSFVLGNEASAKLDLFDVQGRRVRKLCDARYGIGAHTISWDGRDDGGLSVPSGIFFARFQAGDFVQVRKLVRLESR